MTVLALTQHVFKCSSKIPVEAMGKSCYCPALAKMCVPLNPHHGQADSTVTLRNVISRQVCKRLLSDGTSYPLDVILFAGLISGYMLQLDPLTFPEPLDKLDVESSVDDQMDKTSKVHYFQSCKALEFCRVLKYLFL